jgi:hypothetical protein
LVEAVRQNLKPRDIITRKSIENAVAVVMATGGSTNAVLHYLAIASSAPAKVRCSMPSSCRCCANRDGLWWKRAHGKIRSRVIKANQGRGQSFR